ncbi:MAG: hypothetical protein CVV27_04930 [Candidatus Melainabacteria bacterium HGW-Melainabacteria-1]|nr:MAG: hypothetical protein CVV27_04930 [Candidatus Melainabacteria bacterium HGW-Melainabacteria-1]
MNQLFFSPGPLSDLGQNVKLSPDEVREKIVARAVGLANAGLNAGDRVLLSHANTWQFLCDLLACWHLGLCAVPIDPQQTPPEVANLLSHSQAKGLIYRANYPLEALRGMASQVNFIDSDSLEQAGDLPEGGLCQDEMILLLYTSGSTGEPKGVMHSFRSLTARLSLLEAHVPLEHLQRSLNLLPTYFGHSLICNCLYPWLNGQHLLMLPAFNLATVSLLGQLIDSHAISFLSSVPSLWRLALRVSQPPTQGSLKLIHCGSSPLSADLRQQIQAWSGIDAVRNVYGITETGSWLAGSPEHGEDVQDGYIGPVWGGKLRIGDDAGKILPTGEPGLVWVQTPALMLGYYQRPDLSAKVLQQGWFLTGDIGQLDDRGHLTLVGRQRHEINKGGLKIYPEDIDLVLERHPDVLEACSFAIDDPVAGQNVAVAIVPRTAILDLDALRIWLAGQLSPHKHPQRWFVVKSIPRTSRGKLNREAVAQQLLEATQTVELTAEPTAEPTVEPEVTPFLTEPGSAAAAEHSSDLSADSDDSDDSLEAQPLGVLAAEPPTSPESLVTATEPDVDSENHLSAGSSGSNPHSDG